MRKLRVADEGGEEGEAVPATDESQATSAPSFSADAIAQAQVRRNTR